MSADAERIAIVAGNIVTAFGDGLSVCWSGLLAGKRALSRADEIVSAKDAGLLGRIPGLDATERRFDALLERCGCSNLEPLCGERVLLATTLGNPPTQRYHPGQKGMSAPVPPNASVVSAACASSTAALCLAADLLCAKRETAVRVVAADVLSEFVYSGFASLGTVDTEGARPFDATRSGLSLGEAGGWMLLMSESRARRENREILGFLAGWGQRNDAHHLTAPHREARGLIASIRAAQEIAARRFSSPVISFCAHGTGTRYNDAMEMKAARACFEPPVPLWSVKGAIGHTLAASGLVEAWLCLAALHDGIVPQTIGCTMPEDPLAGVTLKNTPVSKDGLLLTTNSGFGGINGALLLAKGEA